MAFSMFEAGGAFEAFSISELVFGYMLGTAGNVIAAEVTGDIKYAVTEATGTTKAEKPGFFSFVTSGASASIDEVAQVFSELPVIGSVFDVFSGLDGETLDLLLNPIPGLVGVGVVMGGTLLALNPNLARLVAIGAGGAYGFMSKIS